MEKAICKEIMSEQEWKDSGVTFLAARPSKGKSALAINIVLETLQWIKKPIVWFSLEMSTKQLVHRFVRSVSHIINEKKDSLDETGMEEVFGAYEKLNRGENLIIEDTMPMTVSVIEYKLQSLGDVGMVVIDYLQLLSVDSVVLTSREEEIRWIVQKLSNLSKERKIPILILSQISREIEKRDNKRPCLEDMKTYIYPECPEDVDQMIFIYREDYDGKDTCEEATSENAEIIVAKSKFGDARTIYAKFDKEHLRFEKTK